jgi:hypothetical protein
MLYLKEEKVSTIFGLAEVLSPQITKVLGPQGVTVTLAVGPKI